ncbi:peptidylprolyl isomerase [candidate division KSB1 bacterium]|nr:peptidylprolyl isomerase [candidate division KSB1 bacterium]
MPLLVNGEPIDPAQIDQEIARMRPQYQQTFTDQSPEEQEAQLKAWARENVIERTLLRQQALKDVRPISPESIEKRLQEMKDQFGGEAQFYQRMGITENEIGQVKQDLEIQLRVERLVKDLTRDIEKPNKKQAYAYYLNHKEQFMTPEQVHAAHIVKHIDHSHTEAQAKEEIMKIKQQLAEGAPFEHLANINSDCPGNAGNLGYFQRGEMVQGFEHVVFNMQIGEVSDVFQTEFGFHIAKVYDHKQPEKVPFEKVKDDIVKHLWEEKRNKKVEGYLDAWRGEAEVVEGE